MMRRAVVPLLATLLAVEDSAAVKPLPDYRYFRALSIDLVGRAPTRDELTDFERGDFDLQKWIDSRLGGPAYAERLRSIYMDQLRLDLPESVHFYPPTVTLNRAQILAPDGRPIMVHYRRGQRRALTAIDGDFCFTGDETGLTDPRRRTPSPLKPVTQALLDARTTEVHPWWLYADYRSPAPKDRIGPDWAQRYPGYELYLRLFVEADKTPTTTVRVCKEEAQVAETGRIYASGRAAVGKRDPLPPGRATRLPVDSELAKANAGKQISCLTYSGFQSSHECGCGVGLERCMPDGPNGFMIPMASPLGVTQPFATGARPPHIWLREWWNEEARRFLDQIFLDDRDVRELVIGRGTMVNGPLAQFYRFMSNGTCCGHGVELGYVQPEALFEPANVPTQLTPHMTATWAWVPDRGPRAAGLLTMPVFLMKYGSARARAHVLYQTFLCKDFQAPNAKLAPSSEPDLTKRPGCASCHRTLEPMAAYFARVADSDWTYLPKTHFPTALERCGPAGARRRQPCKTYYDPVFSDGNRAVLRSAYASPAHADAGPRGLGTDLAKSPEFASCVVQNVAQSFLGRPLDVGADEAAWKTALVKSFVENGYRMRPLVRAIVTSPIYRARSNDRKAK